jgi:hypothetical protein
LALKQASWQGVQKLGVVQLTFGSDDLDAPLEGECRRKASTAGSM